MPQIVGVKFKNNGKIYHFAPNGIEFAEGDGVIVETARGVEYGNVVKAVHEISEGAVIGQLKNVMRRATNEDTQTHLNNINRKGEALKLADEKITKNKLDMKLIDVEFAFDNSKVVFYFTAEGRVDFRELVKDLASIFRTRIELRQVGIRDEAKMLGGLGPCGRACCCSAFLPDFERVSIKMAKVQGLSLNPTKISGLCGRLMCCLKFENDHYSETYKIMPKQGSTVETPEGIGIVNNNDMLKRMVKVAFCRENAAVEYKSFPVNDLKFAKPNNEKDIDDGKSEDTSNND